jgi:hypothetical protein
VTAPKNKFHGPVIRDTTMAMTRGSQSGHRRTHHVAPPHGPAPPPSASDTGPPGVMWPEAGSSFEPSYYSPAGQLQRDARIASNVRQDPRGVWRALRRSWGIWILLGGIALMLIVALISAAVS